MLLLICIRRLWVVLCILPLLAGFRLAVWFAILAGLDFYFDDSCLYGLRRCVCCLN